MIWMIKTCWWGWSGAMIGVHRAQTELLRTIQTLSTLDTKRHLHLLHRHHHHRHHHHHHQDHNLLDEHHHHRRRGEFLKRSYLSSIYLSFLAFPDKSVPSVTICFGKLNKEHGPTVSTLCLKHIWRKKQTWGYLGLLVCDEAQLLILNDSSTD